jgi:hypothetical protein
MGFCHRRFDFVVRALPLLLIPVLFNLVGAQGLQTSPYSAADEVRRGLIPGRLDSAPSNPIGLPGNYLLGPRGSDTIPLSSGMFSGMIPRISNLELGFLYNFGNNVSMGRFSADYVLPFTLSCDSVIFGEAHGEGENFWKTPTVSVTSVSGSTVTISGSSNRVDLSFGGGYRTMLGESTLLGVNGFYDASRLFNEWYSSGGVGLEMAALLGVDAALDLNVNWYGNLFTRDGLINAFRNRGGSFDVEAGYSQSLFNQALDLRLKATGYQFDIGSAVYGWRTGADLTTRDGVFSLKYEYGHDRVNGSYNTVGGFVNIGFQLENILNGESPFALPEPIFNSPRNLRRMLTQKVKRDWHQPTAVVQSRSSASGETGGAGGGCDRFVPSIPVTANIPTNSSFPAFPHASLDPTKHIVVEFDYDFTGVPHGAFLTLTIIVRVQPGGVYNQFVGVNVPMPVDPGHMTFTVSTTGNPTSDQNAFVSTATDPNNVYFEVSHTGTLTNVCIRFNQ